MGDIKTLEEKINEEYKKHPFEFTEDEKRAFETMLLIHNQMSKLYHVPISILGHNYK